MLQVGDRIMEINGVRDDGAQIVPERVKFCRATLIQDTNMWKLH